MNGSADYGMAGEGAYSINIVSGYLTLLGRSPCDRLPEYDMSSILQYGFSGR